MPIFVLNPNEIRLAPLTSIFLLVSSSGRMAGHKIGAIIMDKTINNIEEIQKGNVDERIRLNVLEINDKAQWHIYMNLRMK